MTLFCLRPWNYYEFDLCMRVEANENGSSRTRQWVIVRGARTQKRCKIDSVETSPPEQKCDFVGYAREIKRSDDRERHLASK